MIYQKSAHNNLKVSENLEKGKVIINNIKTDARYRNNCFFSNDEKEGMFTIAQIKSHIKKCVKNSYHYELEDNEIGNVVYMQLWSGGSWAALDSYKGQASINIWFTSVTRNAIYKYLSDIGVKKDPQAMTPGNTVIKFNDMFLMEEREEMIDTFVGEGIYRDILHMAYVDNLPEDNIMTVLEMDKPTYKKMRKKAEFLFKDAVIRTDYEYTSLVLADKYVRKNTVCCDNMETLACYDESSSHPLSEIIGPHLTNAETILVTEQFLEEFMVGLNWHETKRFIVIQRYIGVPAKEVAEKLGCHYTNINNRFSDYWQELVCELRKWYEKYAA